MKFTTVLLMLGFLMEPVFSESYEYKDFKCREKKISKDDKYQITIYQFCKKSNKDRARKIITTHQLGGLKGLVKEEYDDYTYANVDKVKKDNETYEDLEKLGKGA